MLFLQVPRNLSDKPDGRTIANNGTTEYVRNHLFFAALNATPNAPKVAISELPP